MPCGMMDVRVEIYWFHLVWPYVQPSLCRTNHVHSTLLPLKGSFSYFVQIFIIKRRCVMYNNFWSWPISPRSSAHDLAKNGEQNRIRLEGPRRPPPPQLQFRRSRDLTHASIPLAKTPWGLTGRAWLQAGAQQTVIVVVPSFKSLGIDSRNDVGVIIFLPEEGSFSYLVQVFTIAKRCVMYNDFSPWPLSSRSSAHDLAVGGGWVFF